jgi:hypothetical protein
MLLLGLPQHATAHLAHLQAGELLLFLRQNLQLPDDALLARLKWAAVLRPSSSQASMQAVTQALQLQLPLADDQVLPALSLFPDVLGWDVQGELLPRLRFFDSLGPAGKRLLDTMYDEETGYLQVGAAAAPSAAAAAFQAQRTFLSCRCSPQQHFEPSSKQARQRSHSTP